MSTHSHWSWFLARCLCHCALFLWALTYPSASKRQFRFPPPKSPPLLFGCSPRGCPLSCGTWHLSTHTAFFPFAEDIATLVPIPWQNDSLLKHGYFMHLYPLHLTKCLIHRKHRMNGDRAQLNLVQQAGLSLFNQIKNRFLQNNTSQHSTL